jgi:hypothetical protein
MSFPQALKLVKGKRPEACPNLGFELQLKQYASLASSTNNSTISSLPAKNPYGTISDNLYFSPIQFISRSQLSQSTDKSFPEVLQRGRNSNSDTAKHRLTQPKGWRVSYSLKPQVGASSVESRNNSEAYIKKRANFRFGQTNAKKWWVR